jgi:hypothetical protein
MKKYILPFIVVFILGCSCNLQAQWTPTAIDSNQIILLKQVHGLLFTYNYNINAYTGCLYVSTDEGLTWQKSDSAAFALVRVFDVTYDSLHNLYVAVGTGQDGIYYSADAITWFNAPNIWYGDGIVYIDSELIISTGNAGVAISTDSGQAFSPSNTVLFGPFF